MLLERQVLMLAIEEPAVKIYGNVFAAIHAVLTELSQVGISKDRHTDSGPRYSFRGIEDVYSALAPLLAKHGLLILPRVVDRQVREVDTTNSKGEAKVTLYTSLTVEYDFIAVSDGSTHTVSIVGEAMDNGDKSTNKALSAAYKYMALQSFCIRTDGVSVDSETETHELRGGSRSLGVAPPGWDESGPRKLTNAQNARLDLEELVRQAAQSHGFPGDTIFNSPAARGKNLSELLKKLESGTLKGPGAQ